MPDGLNSGPAPELPLPVAELEAWFAERLMTAGAKIVSTRLLPGGAVQHNWRIDLEANGRMQSHLLRAGPAIPLPESCSKAEEFDFLRIAHAAGVPVPVPLWRHDGRTPFLVSRICAGDARREPLFSGADNTPLLRDLAVALAQVHAVSPPQGARPETPAARVRTLTDWQTALDDIPADTQRGLERGLAWLAASAPGRSAMRLVHRDFRTGNFLVEDGRLQAVLDWEFAGWGDPHEDIGWFCAACWRGSETHREAGGLGDREDYYAAYAAAGGHVPDPERVRFWEVFAHMRWAIIALQQGARARAGAHPAWELAEAEARVPGLLDAVADMTR